MMVNGFSVVSWAKPEQLGCFTLLYNTVKVGVYAQGVYSDKGKNWWAYIRVGVYSGWRIIGGDFIFQW